MSAMTSRKLGVSGVADKKPRIWWLLALGLVVACLVIAVIARPRLDPEDARPPPRTKSFPSRPRTTALEDAPPSTPPNPLPLRQPEAQRPEPAGNEAEHAECARNTDCRGPKLADCVAATCEVGRCIFDRSSCECLRDEECDDGVECTRDVCFAATQKCIHIRSACK